MPDQTFNLILKVAGQATGIPEITQLGTGLTNIKNLINPVTIGLAALAAGVTVVAGVIISAIKQTMDWGAQLKSIQSIMGDTNKQAAGLKLSADAYGISVDTITTKITVLARNLETAKGKMGNAGNELTALGINFRNQDGTFKNADDLLVSIADHFAAMPDGIEKDNEEAQIFGRGINGLNDYLKGIANGGMQSFIDKAEKMGLVLSQKDIDAIKNLSVSTNTLKDGLSGIANVIGVQFVPYLQQAVDWLTKLIITYLPQFKNGIAEVASIFGANIPGTPASTPGGRPTSGYAAQTNYDFWASQYHPAGAVNPYAVMASSTGITGVGANRFNQDDKSAGIFQPLVDDIYQITEFVRGVDWVTIGQDINNLGDAANKFWKWVTDNLPKPGGPGQAPSANYTANGAGFMANLNQLLSGGGKDNPNGWLETTFPKGLWKPWLDSVTASMDTEIMTVDWSALLKSPIIKFVEGLAKSVSDNMGDLCPKVNWSSTLGAIGSLMSGLINAAIGGINAGINWWDAQTVLGQHLLYVAPIHAYVFTPPKNTGGGRASGGPLSGINLVGERGYELIIGNMVIPHDLSAKIMGFAAGGIISDDQYDYSHTVPPTSDQLDWNNILVTSHPGPTVDMSYGGPNVPGKSNTSSRSSTAAIIAQSISPAIQAATQSLAASKQATDTIEKQTQATLTQGMTQTALLSSIESHIKNMPREMASAAAKILK